MRAAIEALWHLFLIAAACSLASSACSAQNFVVYGTSPEYAAKVRDAAEQWRAKHAADWFGGRLANWSQPCPITVSVTGGASGGRTSFLFGNGAVGDWQMTVTGTPQGILEDVVPHEVLHAVFASRFRRALPRWLDEGSCTIVETIAARRRMRLLLLKFLRTGRGIPFATMFSLSEYPHDVMPLYAQGHSTVEFLLQHGDRRQFVRFVDDGLRDGNWARAVMAHYEYRDLGQLQTNWLDWVKAGSPGRPEPAREVRGERGQENQQTAALPLLGSPAAAQSAATPCRTCHKCRWDPVSKRWICDDDDQTGGDLVAVAPRPGPAAGAGAGAPVLPGPATAPAFPDLSIYATKAELEQLRSQLPAAPDLSGFLHKGDLPAPPDLSQFASKSDVTSQQQAQTKLLEDLRADVLSTIEKFGAAHGQGADLAGAAAGAVRDTAVARAADGGWAVTLRLVAVALGYTGPVGLGLAVGGWLIARGLRRRHQGTGVPGHNPFPPSGA